MLVSAFGVSTIVGVVSSGLGLAASNALAAAAAALASSIAAYKVINNRNYEIKVKNVSVCY